MKTLVHLARSPAVWLTFCITIATSARSQVAVFENKTKTTATVKVIGPKAAQATIQPNGSEQVALKGGEYYFKVHFSSPEDPRYAVGPYFFIVDEPLFKHEVTIPLEMPKPNGLYQITRQGFDDESGDGSILKKANQSAGGWIRWATIVLDVVTDGGEDNARSLAKASIQLGGGPATEKNYWEVSAGWVGHPAPTITRLSRNTGSRHGLANQEPGHGRKQ